MRFNLLLDLINWRPILIFTLYYIKGSLEKQCSPVQTWSTTDPAYKGGDGAAEPVEDVEYQEAAHWDEEAFWGDNVTVRPPTHDSSERFTACTDKLRRCKLIVPHFPGKIVFTSAVTAGKTERVTVNTNVTQKAITQIWGKEKDFKIRLKKHI